MSAAAQTIADIGELVDLDRYPLDNLDSGQGRMLVTSIQASLEAVECSQSLASLRHLPSQAKVRSTTHRRGKTSKPFAASDRLMISIVQPPFPARAMRSFSPA